LNISRLIHASASVQIAAIRLGFKAVDMNELVTRYQILPSLLTTMLGLTSRGLRYRLRKNLRLDSAASERILRLARVANHANEIFCDPISTGEWLMRPHFALGDATPLSMLDTAYGEQGVERIMCSIKYGLPA